MVLLELPLSGPTIMARKILLDSLNALYCIMLLQRCVLIFDLQYCIVPCSLFYNMIYVFARIYGVFRSMFAKPSL